MLSPLVKVDDHPFSDVQSVEYREIPTPAAPAPKSSPGPAQGDPANLLLPYIDVKLDFEQKIYWAAMRPSQHPMITMELLRDMMCVQESVRAIMEEGNREQCRHLEYFVAASLGLLTAVNAARLIDVATTTRPMSPVSNDPLSLALMTASLMAGTGWTLGVMHLVYARLNAQADRANVELARRDAALQQLIEVAAHELRTPLTSILGALKLLSAHRRNTGPGNGPIL